MASGLQNAIMDALMANLPMDAGELHRIADVIETQVRDAYGTQESDYFWDGGREFGLTMIAKIDPPDATVAGMVVDAIRRCGALMTLVVPNSLTVTGEVGTGRMTMAMTLRVPR